MRCKSEPALLASLLGTNIKDFQELTWTAAVFLCDGV